MRRLTAPVLLQAALTACMFMRLPAQCMDVSSDCMSMAIAGECTSNAAYMAVQCKASCGLCGVVLSGSSAETDIDEGSFDSVPLMFSGQTLPSEEESLFEEQDENNPTFVGGDIQVVLMQPTLADRCCWGANVMIRYETSGALSVPEDGIVVFRFSGKEADVMPFARGEFHAFVQNSGRYPLEVAVESHDRSLRLALTQAELLVTEEGPMLARVWADEAQGSVSGGPGGMTEGETTLHLQHALRPHPNASCSVHCISSDELDEMRADAAHHLFQRSLHLQAAVGKDALGGPEAETFVVQIGA